MHRCLDPVLMRVWAVALAAAAAFAVQIGPGARPGDAALVAVGPSVPRR